MQKPPGIQKCDGPTDGRTDGRTDKASYRVACPQLKRQKNNKKRQLEPSHKEAMLGQKQYEYDRKGGKKTGKFKGNHFY